MNNNHSYILLLLCVLLIFILIQKNREYFENEKDEEFEKELKQTFDEDKAELDAFLEKYQEKLKSNSYLKKIDTNVTYDQVINNEQLEEYKKNIEIKKQDKLKIYFTHKLFEEEGGNDVDDFKIYYLLLVIELDSDNQNHRLISFKLLTENPVEIFPNFNLVPDTDKFKQMENTFEDKIGSMPNPTECVIS